MKITQNDMEHIQNMMSLGEMTAEQANVELVKIQRVKLITTKIPQQVRNWLNAAVKAGELRRVMKKDDLPEAYFHPKFEFLVTGIRKQYARERAAAILEAKKNMFVSASEYYKDE